MPGGIIPTAEILDLCLVARVLQNAIYQEVVTLGG